MKKISALLLFSGGLDSILSAKILQAQNIHVTGLALTSYFFTDQEAKKSAQKINLPLISHNFSKTHLAIVKHPQNGYGKALNPCIDCHALMFKTAKKVARKKNIDIIATGEVLGQRPFSQNKEALLKIEHLSGLKKKLLRPLSAQLLPPTVYEENNLVDRTLLLSIEGKNRQKQMSLVKKYKLTEYPSPAGGCLLTEIGYVKKLKELLAHPSHQHSIDFKLVKFGRHFWGKRIDPDLPDNIHLILGRNKQENDQLEKLAQKENLIIKRKDTLGPTALIKSKNKIHQKQKELIIKKVKRKIIQLSTKRGIPKDWIINDL